MKYAYICLCMFAAVSPIVSLADESKEKDFITFRKGEIVKLEVRLVSFSETPENALIMAAIRSATTDVDAIVAEVTRYFERVRSTAVGSLVNEDIGGSSRRFSVAAAISHADQVRANYIKYYDRLAKAIMATSGDTPEDRIARQYIDGTLQAAEKFIFAGAAELEALGESVVATEWSMLVLLLRNKDAVWNKELVRSLPEWMRSIQSLKAAEYVCLGVERPKAAYYLWVYQISGDREEVLELNSYLTNLHRRADACFGSKDFLDGIIILKAIIALAKEEGMVDEAVKFHFRLAEVYTMYGHSLLASDEMKSVMTTYPTHKEYNKAVLMRLQYLYQSGAYKKILEETPALLEDKAVVNCRPQIIYVAWITNRRQNNNKEAERLQNRFIHDYPKHPLGADMYFSSAMELLAADDYAGATQLLEMIVERYGKTSTASKSREILSKLKDNRKFKAKTPSSAHGGG